MNRLCRLELDRVPIPSSSDATFRALSPSLRPGPFPCMLLPLLCFVFASFTSLYLVVRLPHFLFILHLGLGWAVFLLAFLDDKHYSLWLGRKRATFESDLE
jgi:hypothetical protein